MNAKTIVVKKVNEPAYVALVEDSLNAMQSIVQGHLDPLIMNANGQHQMMIMRNEEASAFSTHPKFVRQESMPMNFMLPGGIPVYGPAFASKCDGNGDTVSLSKTEANSWVDFFNALAEKTPAEDLKTPTADSPAAPYLTDAHQVLVLPTDQTDEETGDVLSPEELISRIASEVGYNYKPVAIDDDQIYGIAIACLEGQGVDFTILDEATMLLDVAGSDDDGNAGRVKKYLRVIEIVRMLPRE